MAILGIIGGLIVFILATFWIWVPILVIALVVRSNNKKKVLQQGAVVAASPQVSQQVSSWQGGVVAQSSEEFDTRELNEELYAELRKDEPDVDKMKGILRRIEGEQLAQKNAEQQQVVQGGQQTQPMQNNQLPVQGSYSGSPVNPALNYGNYSQAVAQSAFTAPVKPKDDYAGLNAILYIGSLLVVAGVGALLVAALDEGTKVVIMLMITAIFYGGGLVVRRDTRLKPAGGALVGTALAIIPFLGFAFAGWLHIPSEIAWLLTNVLGLVAYVVATIALNSKVIAFMSMAFLLSLALSMSATLALPMMFYFIFVMFVGAVAGMVQIFAGDRVPAVFREVVKVTGKWLTISTLAASVLVAPVAERQMYVWLFWIAAVQLAIVWWNKKTLANEIMMRCLAHLAILVTFLDIFNGDLAVFGIVFAGVAMLHGILSIALGVGSKKYETRAVAEWVVEIIMMFLAVLASVFVLGSGNSQMAAATCLVGMVFVVAASGVSAAVYKKTGWMYGVMLAMMTLPWIFGEWVLAGENSWSADVYYVIYIVEMMLVVGLRALIKKKSMACDVLGFVGVSVFGILPVLCAWNMSGGMQVLALAIWALGFGGYGWIARSRWAGEVGAYVFGVAIWRALGMIENLDTGVMAMLGFWVMAATCYLMSRWREKDKPDAMKVRMGFCLGLTVPASVATWFGVGAVWQIVSLLVVAGAWLVYGIVSKLKSITEIGVYFAGILACRVAAEMLDAMKVGGWTYTLVFAHIMAVALIGLSWWLEREKSKVRLGLAVGILTAVVGMRALSAGTVAQAGTYPLWFLLEQAALVVFGGVKKIKWMWVWGACGISLAVLWFIRDVAFLWLILLGFGLIALVVWQLLKAKKN